MNFLNMRNTSRMVTFIAIFGCQVASAGGISDGGGELVMDSDNPWFIQNTTEVHYCIKKDSEHFQVDNEAIDQSIQNAFQYWKAEFARAKIASNGSDRILVATQDFIQSSCSNEADIVFQMGFLTSQQRARMGDVTRVFAHTARTSFDSVNLRGKGFVYVSPETGPDAVKGDYIIDKPWSLGNHGLLTKILIHELGHVFGLKHSSGSYYGRFGIMTAYYPEFITRYYVAPNVEKEAIPPFFSINELELTQVDSECFAGEGPETIDPLIASFFGIPSTWKCVKITHQNGILYVRASETSDGPRVLIGAAVLDGHAREINDQVIDYWLPPEQNVFLDFPPKMVNRTAGGPMVTTLEKKGIYKTIKGGISRELFVELSPYRDSARIAGVLDGKLYMSIMRGN